MFTINTHPPPPLPTTNHPPTHTHQPRARGFGCESSEHKRVMGKVACLPLTGESNNHSITCQRVLEKKHTWRELESRAGRPPDRVRDCIRLTGAEWAWLPAATTSPLSRWYSRTCGPPPHGLGCIAKCASIFF